MSEAAQQWQAFSENFFRIHRKVNQVRSVNLNSAPVRESVRNLVQQYFRQARPALQGLEDIEAYLQPLDESFRTLLELTPSANKTASYKKQIKAARSKLAQIAAVVELSAGENSGPQLSIEDIRVIQTLEGLLPSAALSYRQALYDLADERRISFRGPALELRESLRETLDYLAPDDEVLKSPGFALERGRQGPTMKQKVRFILRARGQSKGSAEVPEQTANTIDEMIGGLTRSIYDRSSVATHVATDRKTVEQIRRYVTAILHHILEL